MPGTVLGTALNKWYFRRVEVQARAKEGHWSRCYLGVPTESNAKALTIRGPSHLTPEDAQFFTMAAPRLSSTLALHSAVWASRGRAPSATFCQQPLHH